MNKKFVKVVVFLGVFSFLFINLFSGVKEIPFHQDEHIFLERSQYFELLFIKKDFENKEWSFNRAYDHPLVGFYLYGLALKLFNGWDLNLRGVANSYSSDRQIAGIYNWPVVFQEDGFNLNDFPEKFSGVVAKVYQGRIMATLFAFGCLILVFFLGVEFGNIWIGFVSALLLGTNRLMLVSGRRAMLESPLMFFMLLSSFSIIKLAEFLFFVRTDSVKILMRRLFVLGLVLGLTVGVKLNGMMLVIFWVCVVCYFCFSWRQKSERLFWGGLFTLFVAFLVFILHNPYLYKSPFLNSWKMLDYRLSLTQSLRLAFPFDAIYGFNKFAIVIKKTILTHGYNNFNNGIIDLFLFFLGSVLVINESFRMVKKKFFSKKVLFLILLMVIFSGVVFSASLNWGRYYLPLIPFICLFQAYGMVSLFSFLFIKFRKIL